MVTAKIKPSRCPAERPPLSVREGGEEHPTFTCLVQAVERAQSVEIFIDFGARRFTRVPDEVVDVCVGVGDKHVEVHALTPAMQLPRVQPEERRRNNRHRSGRIWIDLVRPRERTRCLFDLLGRVYLTGPAGPRLPQRTTGRGSRDGMSAWPVCRRTIDAVTHR